MGSLRFSHVKTRPLMSRLTNVCSYHTLSWVWRRSSTMEERFNGPDASTTAGHRTREAMDHPSERETQKRLLTLLIRGHADQDTLLARLSPEERAARGELYAWSPKDHVAHNNFWRQDAVWRLQAALDG